MKPKTTKWKILSQIFGVVFAIARLNIVQMAIRDASIYYYFSDVSSLILMIYAADNEN